MGTGAFSPSPTQPWHPPMPTLQVVALYPGMAYNPLQYRSIPNYPKIDRDNSYIIGR